MAILLSRIGKQRARYTAYAALTLMLPLILVACGGSDVVPTAATTKAASSPAASGSAAAADTGVAALTTAGATADTDPRGVAPTRRGGGGTLRLLWWQAPTILNAHLAQGMKDMDASRLVEEPLALTSRNSFLPDVPVLVKEIPTTRNGELAADGKSVTWKLKDGVKWSDGTPFTSADVKATWQYIVKSENGAVTAKNYANVADVDASDPTMARVTFKDATALWYLPFTNVDGVVLQKAQIDKCNPDPKNCIINIAPIGTGPYVVKSFMPGDTVQYSANSNYREANAPFFDAVDLKGGGDAVTAAKAVRSGQVDYAWNLQVTPDILTQLTDSGKSFDAIPGNGVEHIVINFTDPNKDVNGEKSSVMAPHPFLTDPAVRQALSLLIDRDSIAKNLYGAAGKATCNIIAGVPPQVQSRNTICPYDPAKANRLLDDAGWRKGADGIRARNGVKLAMVIGGSTNGVREQEEQIMRQAFKAAGIEPRIKNADASVYFGQPDNADAAARAERDLLMLTRSSDFPDTQYLLATYTSGEIAQKANGWKGSNYGRWSSPEYDALYQQLTTALNPDKRAQIEIQLNDLLIKNNVLIPLVDRQSANGHRADLVNTAPTPWDSAVWNIAYWQIKK